MTNFILFLFITIFSIFLLYVLKINDFNVLRSINWIIGLFKKKTTNLKNLNEKTLRKKEYKNKNIVEDNLELEKKFEEKLQFNIKYAKDLSAQEIELRKRILDKVKNQPSYFVENGQKKIIVPLESLVFLNNDYNPLVNENGEILLNITKENNGYKIESKENEEVYLENEETENIQNFIKNNNITLSDLNELIKKQEENKESKKQEESEEDFEIEIPQDIIEELDLENKKNNFVPNLEQLTTDIEIEEETKEDHNIYKFLKEKKWETVENSQINFKDIENSLNILLSGNNIYKLFSNIIKHKNIIMNDNKTGIFVDNIILYNSISRLTGNNYKTNIAKFAKMPAQIVNKYKKTMTELLKEYLYDEKNKGFFSVSFFKENSYCFKGYGLWINIELFKGVFDSEEDFDFFRSYPTSSLKVSSNASQEKCPNLITSVDNIEI